jgi:cytochrome P450
MSVLCANVPVRSARFRGLLDECHSRYGHAFTLLVAGQGRFVMLSDPEAVRAVFQGDPEPHSGEANSLFTATIGRNSVLAMLV